MHGERGMTLWLTNSKQYYSSSLGDCLRNIQDTLSALYSGRDRSSRPSRPFLLSYNSVYSHLNVPSPVPDHTVALPPPSQPGVPYKPKVTKCRWSKDQTDQHCCVFVVKAPVSLRQPFAIHLSIHLARRGSNNRVAKWTRTLPITHRPPNPPSLSSPCL